MRHDPSFRLTLRLSERATAADLFLREETEAKAGHRWRAQCPTSTIRQGPAAPQALAEMDYVVDYQWGRSELSAVRPFLCSWHAPRRLLLHTDRANISRNTGLCLSQKRGGPQLGWYRWRDWEPATPP